MKSITSVKTSKEELGRTKTYLWSKRLSKTEVKVPNLAIGRQIGAVCLHEKEGMAIHSFNTCPKAPHGSQMQCCKMRRRIGKHQNILEEQMYFNEVKSAKPAPGSQIRHVCPCEKEMKAIHSFNICPKAPHGSQIQCCNMRRRIGKHQNILEEQTSFKESQSANRAQAAKLEPFAPVKMR